MSNVYNARIIFGFPAPSPVSRDRKTGEAVYLGEWLDSQRYNANIERHNAECSNGGDPDVFVGVVVAELRDFTRG
jgi:hypothetical protein